MFGVRINRRQPVGRVKYSCINRHGCIDAVADPGNFEIRRIVQRRIDKNRPWREGCQNFSKIERDLRGIISVPGFDEGHVVATAPCRDISSMVFCEDIKPAARNNGSHPRVENGKEKGIVSAERMADHADPVRVYIRERTQ